METQYQLPSWVTNAITDSSALDFLQTVFEASELWDDIIDKDNEITDANVSRVMQKLLLTFPRNEFYRTHYDALGGMLVTCICSWKTANELKDGVSELAQSYTLRKEFINLVVMCTAILYGVTAAEEISLVGWKLSALKDDYSAYIGEI